MASRVNIKFVALLAGFFIIASGAVVGGAYMVLNKSGESYMQLGDEAFEAGDYKTASQMYGRAVGHERTRVDWLEKWLDALTRTTPETRIEYQEAFNKNYMGILAQLATLQPDDAEAQRRYLEAIYDQTWWIYRSAEAWQSMIDQATEAIGRLGEDAPGAPSLKRYRGLAGVEMMRQFNPNDTIRETARADLREALDANPDDAKAAAALARWHMTEWRNARRARRVEIDEQLQEQVVAQIESLERNYPDHPLARIAALELRLERALIASDTYAARRAALRGLQGSEQPIVEVVDAAPTDLLDGPLLSRYQRVLRALRESEPYEPLIRAARRVLDDRPEDPQIQLVLAGALQQTDRHGEAVEVAGRVADAPDLPLSLEGLLLRELRVRAVATQADSAMGMWEDAEDAQRREALMERIKAHRSRLVEMTSAGEESPSVLMLDARLSLLQERYQAALAALEQYRRATNARQAPEVLRLMTRALIGDNQLGAARETVELLLQSEPDNTQALLLAAEIDRRLLEPERAVDRLRMAVEIEPENEAFRSALRAAQAATGVVPEDSPVLATLVEVNRLLAQGGEEEYEDGESRLETLAAEHPDDPRPLLALVELEISRGDIEAARRRAQTAAEEFPDNSRVLSVQRRLNIDDPVEYALNSIEESNADEVEKLLRKRSVLQSAGRAEEAEQMYARAKEKNPDHPLILEVMMSEAIAAGEFEEAERIAQRAAQSDADDVGGQIFEARLRQARGEHAQAVETLQRVVDRLPYSGRAWQMLGQSQLQLGRVNDAVESLRRSFESRPDDVRAAQALAGALLQLERRAEALEIAQRSAKLNPGSSLARRLRLNLEEVAGDKEFVIEQRRRLLEITPDDFENHIALIRTLTSAGRWDEAADLIDRTRQRFGDSLPLARREALLLLEQGLVDEGRDRLASFLTKADGAGAILEAHMSIAEYLLSAGRTEEAIDTLREGRSAQSPEGMEIDRAMGDALFDAGRYEEAAQAYERVVDAGEEAEDAGVLRRLAETYIRLQRWSDASDAAQRANAIESGAVENLLLLAEVALGQGREREGQELLNQAVEAAPNNPLPFIRRARANMNDPNRYSDAMSDLEQALRLQPNSIPAREMKAVMLARRGRTGEAVTELNAAVRGNPRADDLRMTLIGFLLNNAMWDQAINAAEEGVRVSSRDPQWLRVAADAYMSASEGQSNRSEALRMRGSAADLLREAYEKREDAGTAVRLIWVLMSLDPPRAREALDLLDTLGEETRTEPRFLLVSARAKSALGDNAAALSDARRAFELIDTDDEMRLWFSEASQLFSTPLETARFARELAPPPAHRAIYEVRLASLEAADLNRRSALIARLREVEEQTDDRRTLVELYRLRSRFEYQAGDYQAAAETLAAGRELAPEDGEFNNNLAFVLAKHLGDLETALEPAEKAAELAPNDANTLDTLGWIYLRMGRIAQAQAMLQRAVERARTPASTAPASIHLAEVYLLNEEFLSARSYLERAQEALRQAPDLAAEYQPELDSLMQRLDQAER